MNVCSLPIKPGTRNQACSFGILLSVKENICPYCELIIAQKSEIEDFLRQILSQFSLKFDPEDYLVFGTMERKDWAKSQKEPLNQGKALDVTCGFKDVWMFEIKPAL